MRDQLRLPGYHAIQQGPIRLPCISRLRIMPGNRKVGQHARRFDVAPGSEILERTHAQMTRRYPGQYGSRQRRFAEYVLPCGHRGQRPGGGHAQRCHGLAHDVLAQDGTERRPAIAAARERSPTGAFELDIVAHPVAPHHLAQQDGAAIAELRHEMAELVAGIRLRQRLAALGHAVSCQDLHAFRARQRVCIQSQHPGPIRDSP